MWLEAKKAFTTLVIRVKRVAVIRLHGRWQSASGPFHPEGEY
jgi:hypothetical protein